MFGPCGCPFFLQGQAGAPGEVLSGIVRSWSRSCFRGSIVAGLVDMFEFLRRKKKIDRALDNVTDSVNSGPVMRQ